MCSGVIGASSFVGEKEHKTMESLLYTPISMERLLRAKILGVFVPSYIITLQQVYPGLAYLTLKNWV
jgi:ABC-type Na+ efflux pump permease subunit